MAASGAESGVFYLDQATAQQIDVELMGDDVGYSVDQLMELAGLSCACAVRREYPPATHRRVLVVCGPGNNGGDGLVCARHLTLFGYAHVHVVLPKLTTRTDLYARLVRQVRLCDVEVAAALPDDLDSYELVVDAVFGFSFSGDIRAPFDTLLARLKALEGRRPIVAVDIPSGFDVERGNVTGLGLNPSMLISLTAPKMCARTLGPDVHHYLGGRFVPRLVQQRLGVELPPYPDDAQCVKLPPAPRM